ncbi:DUF6344 domain-containing protein [Streptomyces sp. M10(2022)]
MSTFRVKSIWTAFITVFFALLAALGLASTPAAATKSAATPQKHTVATAATANTPSVRWTLPRDRALPPTMKQRIHAEAHGSSPSARSLSTDTTDVTDPANDTRSTHGAQAGDSSPLPP